MNTQFEMRYSGTADEMSDAIKLRYVSYVAAGAIDHHPSEEFRDQYDDMISARTCVIYEGLSPVASIRACIYDASQGFLSTPGVQTFKDDVEREIGLDKIIVEANRFVIHPDKVESKQLFKLPFRFIILNAVKLRADAVITAVRTRHTSVYKRLLSMEPISDPRVYPGTNVEMVMMAVDYDTAYRRINEREELFRISQEELDQYTFLSSEVVPE